MAVKKTGISLDLIIHPGETIGDVLKERNITQADLAARTGVSPAFVSNVIAGNKDISADFAMALEYALGVPKSFWLNLQANYTAELLEARESLSITDEEYVAFAKINKVVIALKKQGFIEYDLGKEAEILALRKSLHISNIAHLGDIVPTGVANVATAVDKQVLGAWYCFCQTICENMGDSVHSEGLSSELEKDMLENECDLPENLVGAMAGYVAKRKK